MEFLVNELNLTIQLDLKKKKKVREGVKTCLQNSSVNVLRSFVQTVYCFLVLVGHILGVSEPPWFWGVSSSFQRWLCPITYTHF